MKQTVKPVRERIRFSDRYLGEVPPNLNDTFVVSKAIARTSYEASQVVLKMFPDKNITRYDYAQGFDRYGTQLNHNDYWYYKIEEKYDN